HTIVYERLVEDVEAEVRPLFDFLDLEWQDAVLDHRRTARARGLITTASYSQVTEPIYKRAAGRWLRYRSHLEPILPTLRAWLDAREARLRAGMAALEARADEEQQQRIARFRSNVLRRTRPYHSEPTHFHYPGLAEYEFHPRSRFPWLDELEGQTDLITAEVNALMASEGAELVPYIQYADHLPMQ